MALNSVTLTGTYLDGQGTPLYGTLIFTPSAPLTDSADDKELRQQPITITLNSGGQFSTALYATDNSSLQPSGWTWAVTENVGGLGPVTWSFFLPFADGSPQDISSLAPAISVVAMAAYLPESGGTMSGTLGLDGTPPLKLPTGTNGDVLTSDASGNLTLQPPSGGGLSNPMTTAGDLIDGGASGTPQRLAGNTSTTKNFLTSTGTGSAANTPAWGTLAAGDLPTGTTSAKGALQLDGTSGDIAALGAQAAGSTGKAADAGHVHPPTGLAQTANNLSDMASRQSAMNTIAGAVTSGSYLRGNGTNVAMSAIQAGDLPLASTSTRGAVLTGAGGTTLVVAASNAPTRVQNSADYVCTGANDHTVINTAISALPGGGGTVLLSAGTFTIGGAISVSSSNVTLEGTGVSTEISVAGGTNITAAILVTGTGTVEVKIRRLFIQGAFSDSFGDGIQINTPWSVTDTQHVVEDVYITNCPNNGFHVPAHADTRVMLVNRVHVKNCKGNGFLMEYPSITDSVFTDCIADTIGLNGFFIGGANNWFTNCKSFYCGNLGGNNHGFYLTGYNNYFDGCQAQDNYQSGFYGDNTGDATYGSFACTFVNCSADSNGQNGGSTYCRGWQISGAKNWQIIGGLAFNRPYGSNWQKYGISISGASSGTMISNVYFGGNTVAALTDTSAGPTYNTANPIPDWISVIEYGADPSGTADATTQFQAALSAATTGQVVYAPAGTYKTSAPLVIPQGVTLLGDSGGFAIPIGNYGLGGLPVNGTIIKPSSAFTPTSGNGAAVLVMSSGASQAGQQQIRQISVDGSSVPTSNTIHGIQAYNAVAGVKLRDVLVYGGNGALKGNGLDMRPGANQNPDFWDISHCKFSGCGGSGVSMNGSADNYVFACESTGNAGTNWAITNCGNTRFIGCKAEGSTAAQGWYLTAASGFTGELSFTNCTSQFNYNDGWYLTGPGAGIYQFTGCRSASDGNSGTGSAFTVTGSFAGNAILTGWASVPATTYPAAALAISSAASGCFVQVANSTLWGLSTAVSNDGSAGGVLYDPNVIFRTGTTSSPATALQPPAISVRTYGAKGDGVSMHGAGNAAITASAAVLTLPGLSAPSAPSPTTAATGGTVADGTYGVKITYVSAYGETLASTNGPVTTSGGGLSTITIPSPAATDGAMGWYAYVTQVGGSTYTRQQTSGGPSFTGTPLVLTAPPSSGGANPPGSNTSMPSLFAATDVGKNIVVFGAGPAGANLVTTISAYTSATQVTLAASASTTVTASAFTYYTQVDSTAVQAAVTAALATAGASGGAVLYLPPGGYVVSGITFGSRLTVQGAGKDATFLIMDPAASTGSVTCRVGPPGTTVTGCTLRDLTIDGNKYMWAASGSQKGYGYYLGSSVTNQISQCQVINVKARNCLTYGIDVERAQYTSLQRCETHDNGYTTGTNHNADGITLIGDDITAVDCRSWNNAVQGFRCGQSAAVWHRVQVIGCEAWGNTSNGISLGSDTTTGDALYASTVTGGAYYSNGAAGIYLTSNAIGCTVSGASSYNNATSGVLLSGALYCTVTGNTLKDNATGASSNPEIYLSATSTNNTVTGNTVTSANAVNAVKEQNSSTDYNTVTANNLTSTGTAVVLAGTHSMTSANVGFDSPPVTTASLPLAIGSGGTGATTAAAALAALGGSSRGQIYAFARNYAMP